MISAFAARALGAKAWAFIAAIPLWAWCALLALAFAVASGHYRDQRDAARKQTATVKAAYAAHISADIAAMKAAKAAAEAAEKAQRDAMADAAARFAKEKRDAIAKERAVADGLRAGTLRLQKQWRGCESRAGAASGPEGSDAAADDRGASAGRVVRAAADADAQVTYLQRLIRSAPACFVVGE